VSERDRKQKMSEEDAKGGTKNMMSGKDEKKYQEREEQKSLTQQRGGTEKMMGH